MSHIAIDQGHYARGRAALVESLGRWPELCNAAVLARLLEASAHLAVATQRHAAAVQLAAAASQVRESAGRPRSSAERVAVDNWLAPAYASSSEEIAAEACREGHAVLPEDALGVVSASLADDGLTTDPGPPSRRRTR